MALKLANNAVGFLAAALSTDDVTLALQSGQGSAFPALAAGDWCPGTLANSKGGVEIVRVTARNTDTFEIQRAQEGTSAQAFNAGDRFELRVTAGVFSQIIDAVDTAINQARPRVGDIKPWHGAIADIATVHGPGWQLADGTNGTFDLRDRFLVGAGATYEPAATGGAATVVLTAAQMPAHNHPVSDPTHAHGVSDPTHAHSVFDPGHAHSTNAGIVNNASSTGGGAFPVTANVGGATINPAGTGIGIFASGTGIGIFGAATGVTTTNTGGGTAHENLPPYFALAFIEYTGIGVVDPLAS